MTNVMNNATIADPNHSQSQKEFLEVNCMKISDPATNFVLKVLKELQFLQ